MTRNARTRTKETAVDSYSHKGKKRKTNPHVGLVSTATDKLNGQTRYQHDPHIDPHLSWAGKQGKMGTVLIDPALVRTEHARLVAKPRVKNQDSPYFL